MIVGAPLQHTAYTCSAPVLTSTPTLPTLVAPTAAATVPPTASVPSTTPAVLTPAPPTVVVKAAERQALLRTIRVEKFQRTYHAHLQD